VALASSSLSVANIISFIFSFTRLGCAIKKKYVFKRRLAYSIYYVRRSIVYVHAGDNIKTYRQSFVLSFFCFRESLSHIRNTTGAGVNKRPTMKLSLSLSSLESRPATWHDVSFLSLSRHA
jgi:hypothetical protein